MGLCEINHRLIILLAGAEGRGKLVRGQEVAKVGTGRLINVLKQVRELLAVA